MTFNEQGEQKDTINIQSSQDTKSLQDFSDINNDFLRQNFAHALLSNKQGEILSKLLQDPRESKDILALLKTSYQPGQKHLGEFLDGYKTQMEGLEKAKNEEISQTLGRSKEVSESIFIENQGYTMKLEIANGVVSNNSLESYTTIEIPNFFPEQQENLGVSYIGRNENYTSLLARARLANTAEKSMTR